MNIKNIILSIITALSLIMISGCYTPKGGSSIPWNQPAPWEGQTAMPGMARF